MKPGTCAVRVRPDLADRLAHGVVDIAGRVGGSGQRAIHRQRIAVGVPHSRGGSRQQAVARARGDADWQDVGAHACAAGLVDDRGLNLLGQAVATGRGRAGRGPDRDPDRQSRLGDRGGAVRLVPGVALSVGGARLRSDRPRRRGRAGRGQQAAMRWIIGVAGDVPASVRDRRRPAAQHRIGGASRRQGRRHSGGRQS
ncbi:hypothetical protein D3C86_1224850 [compost metagenome]